MTKSDEHDMTSEHRPSRAAVLIGVGAAVGSVLYVLAATPAFLVGKEDPKAECAVRYDERKTMLVDATWNWFPPSWTCRFDGGPNGRVP